MHVERQEIAVLTDASGDAVAYSGAVTGRVLAIHYVKPASGGFTDGVDFDITVEATGEVLLDKDNVNASASFYPRLQVHDGAGAGAVLLADATPMRDAVHVARDRVKITVANGGDGKAGTFRLIIG